MTVPAFLKRKSFWITGVIIVVIGGLIWRSQAARKTPTYETAPVTRQTLEQTVEVTGELKPAGRIELAFQTAGTVAEVRVKVGDAVKKGDVLMRLKASDLAFAVQSANAGLSIAQANLNAKLAGETSQSIRVAETQVEQAQASLQKAQADLDGTKQTTANNITTAETALETAKHNLDNADAIANQTIQNAYDSARTVLLNALGPLQTALTDGDQYTGVDNSAVSQNFNNTLGILESGSLQSGKDAYTLAKQHKQTAELAVKALTSFSSREDILAAATLELTAINDVQAYLTSIQKILAATITSSQLTTADLTARKNVIDADRVSVSTQYSTVQTAIQSVKNSQLTRTQTVQQLQDAYQTSQTALSTAKANTETQLATANANLSIQRANLDGAKATLDLKKAGPRSVDIASLRASVDQARIAANKARSDLERTEIIAPSDGTISDIIPDTGEQIALNVIAIKMVGTASYDVEALVPEADIAKVKQGQTASMTLDAFGDEVKFSGIVTSENPDETKVQDAIYYKIRVQIDPNGHDVKPGMTANVTIKTAERENALTIPLRAVRTQTDASKKIVRVLRGTTVEERTVEIGLRGDEGRVEVLSGLAEGEQVVTGEVTK